MSVGRIDCFEGGLVCLRDYRELRVVGALRTCNLCLSGESCGFLDFLYVCLILALRRVVLWVVLICFRVYGCLVWCCDLDGLALNFVFDVIVVIVFFRSWLFVVITCGAL